MEVLIPGDTALGLGGLEDFGGKDGGKWDSTWHILVCGEINRVMPWKNLDMHAQWREDRKTPCQHGIGQCNAPISLIS